MSPCHDCCKEPKIAKQGFIAELKRRNVIRVGAAYVVIAWLLAQVAELALDSFEAPAWVIKAFLLMLALGLPLALFFAWAFEVTPEGIKKESEIDRSKSVTAQTGRKLDFAIIGLLVVALSYFVVDKFMLRGGDADLSHQAATPIETTTLADATPQKSIAVLPFVNMSADKENEFFADGLSEELLNQLAQISDLQVVGRTSSFSFKDKNEDLRVIGEALNVANLLEGSVRRQGNKVRVTAQLIRVDDGYHLWSNSYDRTMDDVFVIQDDIASNVAGALKIVLDEESWERMQRAGIRNVDAFVEFQKGRELFELAHSGSELMEYLRKAMVHFDRAIELVPGFAAAYWQKSDYYAHVILEASSSDDERAIALRELNEVLEIVYRLSEDPARRSMVDFDRVLFSDDWTPLRDRIEKALAVTGCPTPNWVGEMAATLAYAEGARDLFERVQRCEPLSMTAPLKRAYANAYLGDFERALAVLDEAEVQLGSNAWIAATRQWLFLAQGRHEEALAIAPEVSADVGFFGMSARALPLAMSGDIDGARAAMEEWQAENGRNLRNEIEIHAAIGDRAQANRLAAKLDARPGGSMTLLLTAIYCSCGAPFDLEATPRFAERIAESGLAWPLHSLIRYPAKDW